MPTPFMHLDFAERMRAHSKLNNGPRRCLEAEWGAFCLGNVAPDYQVICDIPREATHFYPLPPPAGLEAHEVMLERYPQLADARALSRPQAVFVAGYCFHLIQDLVWHREVITPFYLQAEVWPADRRVRFTSHNAFLTFLDQESLAGLPETAGATLAGAEANGWLPFAADVEIHRWRDLVARQMRPGAETMTASIFAGRLGLTAEEFAARVADPAWMERQVFGKVPLRAVRCALGAGVERAVAFVNEYLGDY